MVDSIQGKTFTTIQYRTSSGENCTATKNNGIVTVKGDKYGVRQLPLDEFMQSFIKDQSKVNLERSPQKDTVNFSGQTVENKKKINKGLLIGLGSLVVAASIYLLTGGKAKNVAKEAVKTAEKTVKKETSTVAKEATNVAKKTTDVVSKTGKTPKGSGYSGLGSFEDETISYVNRGSMGQDLYDPFNYWNKTDPLSPYYNPLSALDGGVGFLGGGF